MALRGVWGARIPPLFSCCRSLALGDSPLPEELGDGVALAEEGWGEIPGVLCFGGCVWGGSPHLRPHSGTETWGTKVCCANPTGSTGPRRRQ